MPFLAPLVGGRICTYKTAGAQYWLQRHYGARGLAAGIMAKKQICHMPAHAKDAQRSGKPVMALG